MTTKLFGERVLRAEDPRLVTGNGRFLDDLGHDALEVAFVRSPHAHARVVDVDVTDALDVDGLVAIYTYDDLVADTEEHGTRVAEPLPLLIPHPTLTHGRTQHALARDEVNHVGEPVVMVVARDRYVAEDAAERVVVSYDFLPPVVGVDNARRADRTVHDDVPDNVAAHLLQEVGDVDAAMAAAPHRLRLDLDVERSASMPMEGKGVHARWDAVDGSMRVHSSTQTSTSVRAAVAARLGLPAGKVECVAPMVGGGFGVKIVHPWPEEVLVPWAARRLDREVKWVEDRREHFVGSTHERGQIHDVRVGVGDDGRIEALDTTFLHDAGAYCPYGLTIPIITAAQLPGPYKLENYRYEFKALFTSKVPTSPYRGAGRPHAAFVMERVIERIARALSLDSAEVRRVNFIAPDEFPYEVGVTFQDGGPTVYDSGNYEAGLDRLLEAIDYHGFRSEQKRLRDQGRRIGLGLGYYVEGTGIGPYEGAAVKILGDGSVTVGLGLSSQGQGHETVFAQVVADELGVAVDRVKVVAGDTRRIGYGVGTFASRAAVVSGNAVLKAAQEVRRQAAEVAARSLEVAPEDLVFQEGRVHVAGAPERGVDLGQLAIISNPLRYAFGGQSQEAVALAHKAYAKSDRPLPEGTKPGLEAAEYFSPQSGVFAFGCHAAIVEVDPETCDMHIHRYVVLHDCGRIINPMIVDGQIYGGVAQGVGGAFYEKIHYDEDGQMLNASFMDFLIPYATEVPAPEVIHTETPSPSNPLGIKGVGEAGVIPGAATIANALSDALGVDIDRMPVSPQDLFEILHRD